MQTRAVPFLIYHDILPEGDPYTLNQEVFVKQIELLKKLTFSAITVNEFLALNSEILKNNIPHICLTFDDGYKPNYDICVPLLLKYGFKATFYITTGWIDSEVGFSMQQIKDMASKGMQIGSHTVNHVFLPNVSDEAVYTELKESKKTLEKIINDEVTSLSLPGGRNKKKITEIAIELGYKSICTSEYKMNTHNTTPFSLGRVPIKRTFTQELFKNIISGDQATWKSMKLKQDIKFIIQKIIGNKFYHSLWKMKYE